MAARLPRFQCPCCPKEVAGLSTQRIGYASLADHKRERRALVLCPGSETHMPLRDALYRQERLPEDIPPPVVPGQRAEELPLF